jgi:hypothetical protein
LVLPTPPFGRGAPPAEEPVLVPVVPLMPAGAVPPGLAAAAGPGELPKEKSSAAAAVAARKVDRWWAPVLAKKIPSLRNDSLCPIGGVRG